MGLREWGRPTGSDGGEQERTVQLGIGKCYSGRKRELRLTWGDGAN